MEAKGYDRMWGIGDTNIDISPSSALIFKAYSSNFTIKGFTKVVEEKELVNLSKEHNLPFVLDLGSGALMELKKHGLGQRRS